LHQFGAEVVMDIMRTHPMVIIGGILQENPFFVPPDEMLREIRERQRRPTAECEISIDEHQPRQRR
jgi:hypothetical protein